MILNCFHVLEHINKDLKAKLLLEFLNLVAKDISKRPLRKVRFMKPDITKPKERLEHFGQDDC